MWSDRTIQDKELLESNHFHINHVAKGVASEEESAQVGDMLREKVENNGVDCAPEGTPNFSERVSQCD